MQQTSNVNEAARMMSICNACRYCEGHCAVFQAMELRLEFNSENLDYLANLCHNCGSCYHHCQYAKPHEFDVNIPAIMASLREDSYHNHAWPGFMGGLFRKPILWTISLFILSLALLFAISSDGTSFYEVMPHETMAGIFGSIFSFAILALLISLVKFWRLVALPSPFKLDWKLALRGVKEGLQLKYLDGGNGQGCTYPTESPSMARRWFHQLTFWGFIFCFVATSVGTVMHYGLNLTAPYDVISVPKFFGILGGVGLLIGPIGLLALKSKAPKEIAAKSGKSLEISFILLLLIISATGFLLMFAKGSDWVPIALSVHLASVMTFFLTIPYGKFVHGFYRLIALMAFAIEKHKHEAIVGKSKK